MSGESSDGTAALAAGVCATRSLRPVAARTRWAQRSARCSTSRDTELRREIDAGTIDPDHLDGNAAIGFLGLPLTPAQRAAFLDRLQALVVEFTEIDEGNALDDEASQFRVLLAGFPISD